MKPKDVQLMQFIEGNDKQLAEFADMTVGVPIPCPIYPTVTLVTKDKTDFVVVAEGDYIAKHGGKIKVIDKDIIHFLFTSP